MKLQLIIYLLGLPFLLILGDFYQRWPRRWPLLSLAGLVVMFLGLLSLLPQISAWPIRLWTNHDQPWSWSLILDGPSILWLIPCLGAALVGTNFASGLKADGRQIVLPVMIFVMLTAAIVSADNISTLFTAMMLASTIHYGQILQVTNTRQDRLLAKTFFLLDYVANGLIFFGLLATAYLLPGTSFKYFLANTPPAVPLAAMITILGAVLLKFFAHTLLGHLPLALPKLFFLKQFFIWAMGATEIIFLFYKTQHVFIASAHLTFVMKILLALAGIGFILALRAKILGRMMAFIFFSEAIIALVFALADFWPLMMFFSINFVLVFLFIFFLACLSKERQADKEELAILADPIQDWPFLYLLFLLVLLNLGFFPGTPGHLGLSALFQQSSSQPLLRFLVWAVIWPMQLVVAQWMFVGLLNPLFAKPVVLRRQRPMRISLMISLVAVFFAALSAGLWFIVPCPWNPSLNFGMFIFGPTVTYLPAAMAFSMGQLFMYFGTLVLALFLAYLYYFPFAGKGWRPQGQQILRRYLTSPSGKAWAVFLPALIGQKILELSQKLDQLLAAGENFLRPSHAGVLQKMVQFWQRLGSNNLTFDTATMILWFILSVMICLGWGGLHV